MGSPKENHCRWYIPTFFRNMLYGFIQIFQSLQSNLIQALQLETFFIHYFWLNLSRQIDTKKSTSKNGSSTLVLGVLVDSYFFDAMTTVGLGGSPYASKSSWYPSFWFGSFGKSGHGRRQLRGSLAATAPTANAHVPCVSLV